MFRHRFAAVVQNGREKVDLRIHLVQGRSSMDELDLSLCNEQGEEAIQGILSLMHSTGAVLMHYIQIVALSRLGILHG
jgi:hypothetical protein